MWKPFPKMAIRIVMTGILALGGVACSSDTPDQSSTPQTTPVVKAQATPSRASQRPPKSAVLSSATTSPTESDNNYEQALDVAAGAVTISKSAVSRDDWSLVANQWQKAIDLLKAVPAKNANHANAQKKLASYKSLLADAKLRATPLPKKTASENNNPQFFSIPIKGRSGGTPIIEVRFDNTHTFDMLFDTGATGTLITLGMAKALALKPAGATLTQIADGSTVVLPFAYLKSIEIDGRLKRKLRVAVAPPAMPIGLLGQDFFEGYDITIKEDIIEFRRR